MYIYPSNYSLFRYASLYFCCAIEQGANELLTLEVIHRYVELLDKYFGSVCIDVLGAVWDGSADDIYYCRCVSWI